MTPSVKSSLNPIARAARSAMVAPSLRAKRRRRSPRSRSHRFVRSRWLRRQSQSSHSATRAPCRVRLITRRPWTDMRS